MKNPRRRMAVLVVGLVAVVGVMIVLPRPKRPEDEAPDRTRAATPSAPLDLRGEILRRKLIPKDPARPAGAARCVLFDWGMDIGSATLVAFEDGTTSLYTDRGGGFIGMGIHQTVRQAAAAFREEAERSTGQLKSTSEFRLPGPDAMAFFVVTDDDTLGSGPIPVEELQSGRHPLSRLADLGNDVITAMRLADGASKDPGK